MEGEVGAQIAPPIFLHQALFHEPPSLARKRDMTWQNPNFHHNPQQQQNQQRFMGSGDQHPIGNWNPKTWQWDSVTFVARPTPDASNEVLRLGTPAGVALSEPKKKGDESSGKDPDEFGENLTLKLGGGYRAEEPATRPNKRVRSRSPGSAGAGNYPMCQVDDCKADLSSAKDYHRRHKVCEHHSKTTQALVGKQMQRFCQQCSRFHPLGEFDEGKRSCRRRLAGHNRRRRKTQPEDVSSRLLLPGNHENNGNGNLDVVNLFALLAGLQGQTADKPNNSSSTVDRDRLIQIISKINSLPATNSNTPAKLPTRGSFDLNVSQTSQISSETPSAPSTMDLLTVLSSALKGSCPDTVTALSQGSSGSSADDKTKIICPESAADVNSHNNVKSVAPSVAVGRRNFGLQSESCDRPIEGSHAGLPLQLFSSAEDDSPPKLGSSRKYFSSESSNPMEERSPSSSPPVVRKLFPLESASESLKCERTSISREDHAMVEASTCQGWSSPLELLKESERRVENHVPQNLPYQVGYTSSSGSDHSPTSSNSDSQDRTGRIIFKLFDKDPSNFPGTLRTQILNWLSNSPSEIESYIRPGCVVLAIYLSMPCNSWDEFQKDLLHRVNLLVQHPECNLWRSGRFLVHTDRQLVSHNDGKIHLCKSWRTWSSPELICVSPLAVVSGKETALVLRGRNLTAPGTKIHCTYMGGYSSKEVLGSAYPGTTYEDCCLESFNFSAGVPNVYGRCFIEVNCLSPADQCKKVENGFKGNSFPIIIADETICKELRVLEFDFEEELRTEDITQDDQIEDYERPRSREDALHFLNELGWLFQRKAPLSSSCLTDFSNLRFKFLLTFSVERDWCALVQTLLDTLVETSIRKDELIQESLRTLSEIQLLSRAVKRKCRKMVDMLLRYYVNFGVVASKVYLFPPNLVGPGGLTPLHLAASMQDSEDMVDALTSDPQEIALNCWSSITDDSGQSPHAYATMRNNHSYNRLVARKLADRRSCQVSITVENEEILLDKTWVTGEPDKPDDVLPSKASSCVRCAALGTRKLVRRTVHAQGLLHRPYVRSMLAIAAVCVCVGVFLRGAPELGDVDPFKWENLCYGPR